MRRVSRRMLLQRLALAVAVALTTLAALASPMATLASCAFAPDIKAAATSADIVFVGMVTATANNNTWATITVEEIWRGPDQPAQVEIRGGPGGNAATSVDRSFEVGVKYLFFPYVDPASGLADNSCSSTAPWSDDFAGLRPAGAHAPSGAVVAQTGFDLSGILGPVIAAVLVAGVLLAVGLLARSRQAS